MSFKLKDRSFGSRGPTGRNRIGDIAEVMELIYAGRGGKPEQEETMAASEITIFHNPNCGTSRNVLAAIRATGREPKVVEYLKAGWTEAQLRDLFGRMGVGPREVLRVRGAPAEALGLTKPGVSDAAILAAMVKEPILVERPIVVTDKGAALCRPADRLSALL